MAEYYLADIELQKIPKLTAILEEFKLEARKTDRLDRGEILKKANCKDSPDEWSKEGLNIFIYRTDYPVQIRTRYYGSDITKDPNFELIKRIVKELRCKKMVDAGSRPYDLSLFE